MQTMYKNIQLSRKDISSLWVVERQVARTSAKVKDWFTFQVVQRRLGRHTW